MRESESCSSKSGYSCADLSRVGIRNSLVKSRHSHLIRDDWTLCLGFWAVRRGQASPKNLEISGLQTVGNAAKLSILPSLRYIWVILNFLQSHQADLFGSCGGGGGTPPPFLQACSYTPNLTGKKHTISTFVDQTRILLCKGLQTKMASYAPDKKAIFSRNFLSFYFRSTSCKQVHISFQTLYELWWRVRTIGCFNQLITKLTARPELIYVASSSR